MLGKAVFPKLGKRAVILCDGPRPNEKLIAEWLDLADFFICADNAGQPYEQLPKIPDIVLGDFDSIAGHIVDGNSGPKMLHLPDQDSTDGEKAIVHAIGQGCTEAVLLGATGGLLDHTLYNCALIEKFSDKIKLCLCNEQGIIIRCDNKQKYSWDILPNTMFSIIPFCQKAEGVVMHGAAYESNYGVFDLKGPATVSNHVSSSPLTLEIEEGSLLVHFRFEFKK